MTNAEARCNKSLRPRKPEGSLGRTVQDGHLDSHTAPELCLNCGRSTCICIHRQHVRNRCEEAVAHAAISSVNPFFSFLFFFFCGGGGGGGVEWEGARGVLSNANKQTHTPQSLASLA